MSSCTGKMEHDRNAQYTGIVCQYAICEFKSSLLWKVLLEVLKKCSS